MANRQSLFVIGGSDCGRGLLGQGVKDYIYEYLFIEYLYDDVGLSVSCSLLDDL
jgi:hypothetical protein